MHFSSVGFDPAVEEQWRLTCARVREWVQDELLGLNWWILLLLFLITAYIWWKKADKNRFSEIVIFTLLIILFVIVLDELGEELSLWYYTVDLIPIFPPITAIDISCMPLIYMLIYQYAKTWKSFLIATIVMAAVFCFILEPVFVWMGIYKMLTWKSYYGFPIYVFIAVFSKFVTGRMCSKKHNKEDIHSHSASKQ